jgi:hypothetical protein
MPLDTLGSNFRLPELNTRASNMNFGIGQKSNYEVASVRNQTMTIDVREDNSVKGNYGYMANSQMKGMYTAKNGSDIKRNASVAVVNKYHVPKLFNSSRKGYNDPMDSTIEKMDGMSSQVAIGVNSGPKLFIDGISKSPSNGNLPVKTLEFHKRNHSTIGQSFGTDKLESHGFSKQRPSVVVNN